MIGLRKTGWRAVLAAILVAGMFGTASAAEASTKFTAEQLDALQKLTEYFNGFKTLKGEFTQVSPKGNVSAGVFFLSKPGKLRFEYAPPNPFLVVSDGSWVVIENRKQKTTDQYPLATTPLKLLLAENVDLLKEAKVTSVETTDGMTTITIEDKLRLIPGQIVLVYDGNRDQLSQWIVEDGRGKRTTVSVANLETGFEADPKLFVAKVARREGRGKSK